MSEVKDTFDSKTTLIEVQEIPKFAPEGLETIEKTDKYAKQITSFYMNDRHYFGTYWRPEIDPKGLVFLCHGYGEYLSPSYEEIALRLVENGLLVFGHDHIGHGRSSGQRVHVESMEEYVQPVLAHVKHVTKEFNDELPKFIIGHSMGGLISIYVLSVAQNLFKGVVLVGPLVSMNPELATPWKQMLAKIFSNIIPSFALGQIEAEDITRDKKVVQRVKDDPLNWNGGFRTMHSHVLFQATEALTDGTVLKRIETPVILFQGGKDRLVLPYGAQFYHDNVGSTDKKLVYFAEAFHNLYVELDDVKELTISETCQWILQRL